MSTDHSVTYRPMESFEDQGKAEDVANGATPVEVKVVEAETANCQPLEDLTESMGALNLPPSREPPTTPYAPKQPQYKDSDLRTPLPGARNQSISTLGAKPKYAQVLQIIADKVPRIVRVKADGQVTTGLAVGMQHVVTSVHDATGPFLVMFPGGQSCTASTEVNSEVVRNLGIVATGADISVLRMTEPADFLPQTLDSLPVLTNVDLSCVVFAGYNGGNEELMVSVDTGIRMAWTSAARLELPLSDCQMIWNGGKSTGKIDRLETDAEDVVTATVTSPANRVHTFSFDGQSSAKLNKDGDVIKTNPDAIVMIPNIQDGNNLILGNKTAAGGSGGIYFTRDGGILGIHVGAQGEFRLAVIPWSTSKPDFPDLLESLTPQAKKSHREKTEEVLCGGNLDALVMKLSLLGSDTYFENGLYYQLDEVSKTGMHNLYVALFDPDGKDEVEAGEVLPHVHFYAETRDTKFGKAIGHLKHSDKHKEKIYILFDKVFCKGGEMVTCKDASTLMAEDWRSRVDKGRQEEVRTLLTHVLPLFHLLEYDGFRLVL